MKKYISVLLAVFVFVMGIALCGTALAVDLQTAIDRTSKKTSKILENTTQSIIGGIASYTLFDIFSENNGGKAETRYKIDGAKDFKESEESESQALGAQFKGEPKIAGTVLQGKTIRIHNLMKTMPLETVNKNRAKKKSYPIAKLNLTATIIVAARKDGKVIDQVNKTFKDTVDSYVDYKVPQNATEIEIVFKRRFVGQIKSPSGIKPSNPMDSGARYFLAAVPASAAGGEGGSTLLYLGGGLVLVLIGGYIGLHFIGGATVPIPEPTPPSEPEPPAPPPEPEYFTYKDPAGFETLYMKDPETGQWYNYQDYEEGYRVPVDMDKLQEYDAQRREDVKWNRDQMTKLENRETGFDKELKQEYQDMLEREKQIQQETKKDLYALQRGTFGMSNEERKTFLEERQAKDQEDVDKWTKRANQWDTALTAAETVQTAADIGVDIMATIAAPVGGGLVADAYAITKNIAGCGMEGLVNKERTLLGGLAEGVTKGAVDYAQNHSGAKWQKLLSYVGGEGLKGGIDAGLKGESIVKGTIKGALQGGTKLGVDAVGKKIGDKIAKNSSDSLKHAYEHAGDIRNRIAPQVSKRSAEALKKMNLQKHLANMQKGEHQTLANTITNGVARNLLPKVFG